MPGDVPGIVATREVVPGDVPGIVATVRVVPRDVLGVVATVEVLVAIAKTFLLIACLVNRTKINSVEHEVD